MDDWPNLIESHLDGILVFETEKRIEISLALPTGQKHAVILKGVERFFSNGMRERNIVESIRVWGQKNGENDFRSAISWLVTGNADGYYDDSFHPIIAVAIQKIQTGEQVLLEICPIYGVEIVALARSVEFR